MREQIRTWLEIGLAFNWVGLQIIRYHLSRTAKLKPYPLWWDIIGIVLWPMSFAHGVVQGYNEWRRKK